MLVELSCCEQQKKSTPLLGMRFEDKPYSARDGHAKIGLDEIQLKVREYYFFERKSL